MRNAPPELLELVGPRKPTSSCTSSFASSTPATSANGRNLIFTQQLGLALAKAHTTTATTALHLAHKEHEEN